ncbi:MAG: M20/M25/M40 family metallo-hydrolase [Erysipelotrichaceae bacterium]|nr:M20/M25/M40 family metallo-hydrolase [Erysipelotrichaceae bacterium]
MKTILLMFSAFLVITAFPVLIAIIRTLLLKKKRSVYKGSEDLTRIEEYSHKLQQMIRIPTVSIAGKPDPELFRKLHRVMEEIFPHVFSTCEKIDLEGSMLVRWKGRHSEKQPIVLTSHLDVVAAEGEWTYPPFEGVIINDRIYGRGSFDVKSGVMAFYQAVEELIAEGYVPDCDVYLASSCTEEVGGDGAPKIASWFENHGIRPFLLCDEGGAIVEDPIASVSGNFAAVGIFEKGYGDIRIIARGKGGHSSTPGKNTPIARLAKFEAEIERRSPFKVEFTPAVDQLLLTMAEYSSNFWLRMVFHNLWLFKPILRKIMPAISSQAAAMLQTTMCFTMQGGSNGYNVIPQEAYVTANLRFIPFQGKNESIAIVRKIAEKYDLKVEEINCSEPTGALDLGGPQYAMTKDTINKVFPGVEVIPYIVTGGTDSRFYEGRIDASIRFEPISVSSEQLGKMHGIDENIDTNTLPLAVDYYKQMIRIQEEREKYISG